MAQVIERYVHEVDGGWVVAVWDDRSSQWRTNDVPESRRGSGFLYAYARSLDALVGVGARVYPTREAAEAAARSCYYIE